MDVGYERIKEKTGVAGWTFFSDVEGEVESARRGGMRGYLVFREGEVKGEGIRDFGDVLKLVE
jgi:methionine salvage enolase-phosphatase E1